MRAALRELLLSEDKLYPPRLGNLAAWYDLSLPASLTSNDLRIDASNRVSLIADKSGNSATNCLVLPGVAGNYASTPDSAALDITGNIDIRVDAAANDWSPPSGIQALVAKWTTTGNQRSYQLLLLTTGALQLDFSTDGTNTALRQIASNATIAASDFSRLWVRATCDFATSTVRFYTSPDGLTWTQLGTDRTLPSSGATFASTAVLEIGSDASGASSLFAGRIYRAIIKSGIDGTTVFDANFANVAKLATSFTESSANGATVTINQTAIALPARIHGERDLYQGLAASQPVYLPYSGTKYAYLNGVSGNYLSTPDSAAVSIADDIDIICDVSLASWAPAANNHLVSRWTTTGDQRSYRFGVSGSLGAGVLYFSLSTLGTAASSVNYVSTAVTGFAANSRNFVRVHRNKTTGEIKFYTSSNGTSWTQLGTTVSGSTSSMFDGTSVLELGGITSGTVEPMSGRIYRAQVWSGDSTSGGTLAFDFNAQAYVSGTTLTDQSSNAATITINGGATIVDRTCIYFDGSDDYMKAPAFSLSQPETVYFVGKQVTWTSVDAIFDGSGISERMKLGQITSSPTIALFAGTGDVASNTDLPLKTNGVLTSVFNGASSLLRVNRASATTGSPGTNAGNGFTLAARYDGAAGFGNITASEIIIRSVADGVAMQDRIIRALGRKWYIAN